MAVRLFPSGRRMHAGFASSSSSSSPGLSSVPPGPLPSLPPEIRNFPESDLMIFPALLPDLPVGYNIRLFSFMPADTFSLSSCFFTSDTISAMFRVPLAASCFGRHLLVPLGRASAGTPMPMSGPGDDPAAAPPANAPTPEALFIAPSNASTATLQEALKGV